jgi:RNA polymerase sigma-70 factor (ECF subfamily)
VTFFELIHLCTMVDRPRTGSTARDSEAPTMPAHLENEQSLIAAAQAGNADAFVTLLNQYSRHIYRLGLSITGNHHDAEDVLQEASLKAYTALANFEGNSRFYTWLVRIAVNVALGKLRKRALWKESSIDEPRENEDGDYIPLEIESWGESPEKACLNSELQKILAEVIQILDPKSRTVFTLRDVEKFSIEETAKMLGLSVPVIKTRLLRSRLKLREELTKHFGKDARNAMPTGHR